MNLFIKQTKTQILSKFDLVWYNSHNRPTYGFVIVCSIVHWIKIGNRWCAHVHTLDKKNWYHELKWSYPLGNKHFTVLKLLKNALNKSFVFSSCWLSICCCFCFFSFFFFKQLIWISFCFSFNNNLINVLHTEIITIIAHTHKTPESRVWSIHRISTIIVDDWYFFGCFFLSVLCFLVRLIITYVPFDKLYLSFCLRFRWTKIYDYFANTQLKKIIRAE